MRSLLYILFFFALAVIALRGVFRAHARRRRAVSSPEKAHQLAFLVSFACLQVAIALLGVVNAVHEFLTLHAGSMVARLSRDVEEWRPPAEALDTLRTRVWRVARIFIITLIILNFVRLTRPGILEYFNPDDMQNMYSAWVTPVGKIILNNVCFWSGANRPLGAAFYRLGYAAFGFHPRPFRVSCCILLILNLLLHFRLFYTLWPRMSFALLALLACSFHGAIWSLYASTGTVFDILCATFYLIVVIYYIRTREGCFTWRDATVLVVCTVASANSKEMAMSLPPIMLAWAMLFRPLRERKLTEWLSTNGKAIAVVSVVLIVRALGQYLNDPITKMPAFRPTFTTERYLETTKAYVEMMAYRTVSLSATTWIVVIGALLLIAVMLRSRMALFGWLFYNASLLPLSFSTPRHDGYVLYIPFVGVVIYGVALLDLGLRQLERTRLPVHSPRYAIAVVASGVLCLQNVEARLVSKKAFGPGGQGLIRTMAYDIGRTYPSLRGGSRILLINDAFWSVNQWYPMFVMRLRYHDHALQVYREQLEPGTVAKDTVRQYDHVFEYDGTHYRDIGFQADGLRR